MSRLKKVRTAAETQDQVKSEPGTVRASLSVPARITFGVAAITLVLLAAQAPIWRAVFHAPQYPQGLKISAYGDRVAGDLGEIKELSHYIGLPPFNFVGMPEMRLWPFVIALAVTAAVVAVATRRRWLRRLSCAAIWLIPVGALADVQFRLWQTGHSLDPSAAIRVTPFTPRVLGPTSLMNFTLTGLPGTALVLIGVAAAVVTSAPFVARRLTRGRSTATLARQAETQPTDGGQTDAHLKVP
ncbi:MAG: hypothetical protein ABIP19_08065 [Dermatophilaceae bacterium]